MMGCMACCNIGKGLLLALLCGSTLAWGAKDKVKGPKAYGPVPTEQQVKWLRMEWYAFVHFGLNTYTGNEWGFGDESPALFNPSEFDAEEIVKTFKAAGMNGMIYTAKHHDGFCTWPTRSTSHNITKSPWKGGKGDVVREFSDACKKHDFPFGTYLSPWDRNCGEFGRPGYLKVYYKQIEELLTKYGPIFEIWFDGAIGGDGYYGGAREKRDIGEADKYYNYAQVVRNIRKLQKNCIIWGACGRGDVTWGGSEKGFVKQYPLWNVQGNRWISLEADTPINHRGWFWHQNQAGDVKKPEHLMDVYLSSVGRGGNLILNVAPNKNGRLDPADVASLNAFGEMRRKLLSRDYALRGKGKASSTYGKSFDAGKLTDGDIESYWCPKESDKSPSVEIELTKSCTFDVVRLREQIRLGQRVEAFQVDAWVDSDWKTIIQPGNPNEVEGNFDGIRGGKGHTIGNQVLRWLPEPVTTRKLRLTITRSKATPCISEFSLLCMPGVVQPESVESDAEEEPAEKPLRKSGWKFRGKTSSLAFDGKEETMWQSDKCPARFVVDLKQEHEISGFSYLPRQDGQTEGMTSRYRVELSADGKKWKKVSEGEFGNLRANPVEQIINFSPVEARYFRFTSTAALDGEGSSAAEIRIYGK